MYSNKFDTPRQADASGRARARSITETTGSELPNTFSRALSRAQRENGRVRTCNDRFRSITARAKYSRRSAGSIVIACTAGSVFGLGSVFMKGPLPRPSYGLRCIRILRLESRADR